MALKIAYTKVFGVPVAPDSISQGASTLASVPVITGDFVQNISINIKTYTFDLRGIAEAKAQEVIEICNNNAEALALGEINMQDISGDGVFLYRGAKCLPIGYQDGGTVRVGNNSNNYSSFQVTCLTDIIVASV